MEENSKRLIVMSILAYAVGTFILAAGLLTKSSLSITVFYIITMVLIICARLALFKKDKHIKLYLYLLIVGIVFIIINTAAFINNLFL